jgi:hypothetical protein
LKLVVGSNGASKHVLGIAVAYAKSRKAFGQPITQFGLIKEKIGEMSSRIFVAEAMGYRTCGLIDHAHESIDKNDPDFDKKRFTALEEFNIESSILKVYGSEVNGYVVDQVVQIHGGYGYSEEYAVERAYRDSRINRIFEGTNEVNRMLIPGTLLKRAMQGKILLMDYFNLLGQELESGKLQKLDDAGYLGTERALTEAMKRVTVFALQQAAMRYMQDIEKEQEILALIADLCIDVYGMDSAFARATQMQQANHPLAAWAKAATELFMAQAKNRIMDGARQVIVEVSEGSERAGRLKSLEQLDVAYDRSVVTLRRTLAETVIEKEAYPL